MGSIAVSCLATPVGEGDNSLLCHRYEKTPSMPHVMSCRLISTSAEKGSTVLSDLLTYNNG